MKRKPKNWWLNAIERDMRTISVCVGDVKKSFQVELQDMWSTPDS